MKKIYTFLFAMAIGAVCFAQVPQDTVMAPGIPAGVAIAMDGIIEPIWDYAPQIDVAVPGNPAATLEEAYFKMLWNDTAIFVLVSVDDNDYCRACPKGDGTNWSDWQSDRAELFFDFNMSEGWDTTTDGAVNGPDNGIMQYAYGIAADVDADTNAEGEGYRARYYYWGYQVTDNKYVIEYGLPYTSCTDSAYTVANPHVGLSGTVGAMFGFDISIMDRDRADGDVDGNGTAGDEDRKWMKWIAGTDSWNNMNNTGLVILDEVVGINSTSNVPAIAISPNPVVDYLTISNVDFDAVTFYNALGQKVMALTNLNDTRVNVANLPKGLYYMTVTNRNKVVGQAKLIK